MNRPCASCISPQGVIVTSQVSLHHNGYQRKSDGHPRFVDQEGEHAPKQFIRPHEMVAERKQSVDFQFTRAKTKNAAKTAR